MALFVKIKQLIRGVKPNPLLHGMEYHLIMSMLIMATFFISSCSVKTATNETKQFEQLMLKGDAHYLESDFEEAIANYLKAAEINSDDPVTFYKIGLVYGAMHNHEESNFSVVGGRKNRQDRIQRRDDSSFSNAVYYFNKAAMMGHHGSREILRAMYDNIQHLDVQY